MRGLCLGRHCRHPQPGHSKVFSRWVGLILWGKRSTGTSKDFPQPGHQVTLTSRTLEDIPTSCGQAGGSLFIAGLMPCRLRRYLLASRQYPAF